MTQTTPERDLSTTALLAQANDDPSHVFDESYIVCRTPSCQTPYDTSLVRLTTPDACLDITCGACGAKLAAPDGTVLRSNIAERRPVIDPVAERAAFVRRKSEHLRDKARVERDAYALRLEEEERANDPLDVDAERALIRVELETLEQQTNELNARRAHLLRKQDELEVEV